MDLFKDIQKGRFGHNKNLKREAKHELKELGGKKKAEAYEKALEKKKEGIYKDGKRLTRSKQLNARVEHSIDEGKGGFFTKSRRGKTGYKEF